MRIGKAEKRFSKNACFTYRKYKIRLTGNHPVPAVPGDEGGCCKLPVGYRPICRHSARPRQTPKAASRLSTHCGHYNKPKSTYPKASRGTIHQGAPLISWSRFCRSVEPNGNAASLTYWAGTVARKDFRHANRHRYTCLSWSDCSSAGARHSCPAERRAGSGSYANKHFSYHEPDRQRGRIQSHELPGPRDGPTQPVL